MSSPDPAPVADLDPLDRFADDAFGQAVTVMHAEAAKVSTGFPIGRLVAALGPYASILAGIVGTWLANHFPGLNVPQNDLEGLILDTVTFGVGTTVAWLGAHKWLDGLSKWERTVVVSAAVDDPARVPEPLALPPGETPPNYTTTGGDLRLDGSHPEGNDYDPAEFDG